MSSEIGDLEKARLRSPLPSVDALLRHEGVRSLLDAHGRSLVVQTIRAVLDEIRRTAPSGALLRTEGCSIVRRYSDSFIERCG